MKRSARMPSRYLSLLAVTLLASQTAFAQGDGQHKLGLRLFNQSCRVCHTKPTLLSPQYGPTLSKDTLGGSADMIRQILSNGTPRMPGFKYDFTPAQIDAIVAYIKTIPAPTAAPPTGKSSAAPGAD